MTPITAMAPHAGTRDKCSFSCTVAIGASYKLIREVIPARNTAAKKMIAMIRPPGMERIRFGRKMNNSPGPPWFNCAPVVAIAGMMTRAARIAAIVSNNATFAAEAGIFSLSDR